MDEEAHQLSHSLYHQHMLLFCLLESVGDTYPT